MQKKYFMFLYIVTLVLNSTMLEARDQHMIENKTQRNKQINKVDSCQDDDTEITDNRIEEEPSQGVTLPAHVKIECKAPKAFSSLGKELALFQKSCEIYQGMPLIDENIKLQCKKYTNKVAQAFKIGYKLDDNSYKVNELQYKKKKFLKMMRSADKDRENLNRRVMSAIRKARENNDIDQYAQLIQGEYYQLTSKDYAFIEQYSDKMKSNPRYMQYTQFKLEEKRKVLAQKAKEKLEKQTAKNVSKVHKNRVKYTRRNYGTAPFELKYTDKYLHIISMENSLVINDVSVNDGYGAYSTKELPQTLNYGDYVFIANESMMKPINATIYTNKGSWSFSFINSNTPLIVRAHKIISTVPNLVIYKLSIDNGYVPVNNVAVYTKNGMQVYNKIENLKMNTGELMTLFTSGRPHRIHIETNQGTWDFK